MLLCGGGLASSRVAAVAWLWTHGLLLLNIVRKVGERLQSTSAYRRRWSLPWGLSQDSYHSHNHVHVHVHTSSPFRLSCNVCFIRPAILDLIEYVSVMIDYEWFRPRVLQGIRRIMMLRVVQSQRRVQTGQRERRASVRHLDFG
jgi:hypothetical protein